ncbi:uncharacterized protein LOC122014140 [Zingiber officinale]|uniref:uncharacterized protein LOC122014140 n=1 Tax=Zingiber officinale TaxID=94328 RepID=UPI001C4C9727|nr:uncharacterized protein LOC122014140 [Zingiber officinale]
MTTPLFGFMGNDVQPVGQIKLAILLGEEPLRRTRTANFIVVDAPSAYNVILGRPTLNEFRAVVSTFHQKIKFPVEDRVGEVKGDQLAARHCYVEMVRAETRSARKAPCIEVNTITEKPPTFVYKEKEEVQINPARSEATTFIASDLETNQKEELIRCLQQNHDVFAWSTHELACSKDFYPLPRIDQMVDSTTGCELICMLDAYQGYHQVPLTRGDQEKVSFITVDGTYYYNVMPFGLKNAGATYQRLMNKVFWK